MNGNLDTWWIYSIDREMLKTFMKLIFDWWNWMTVKSVWLHLMKESVGDSMKYL